MTSNLVTYAVQGRGLAVPLRTIEARSAHHACCLFAKYLRDEVQFDNWALTEIEAWRTDSDSRKGLAGDFLSRT